MTKKIVYSLEDLEKEKFNRKRDLGEPGKYPFTRGIHEQMYKKRFWTMRQYAGFGSAEETNRRYHYLIREGQTGLSIAFDLPTQIGYDSDDPRCSGEVGKVGVPIDTLKDMEILFRDIPLDKVSTSMTINSTAPILLAMYIALARKQGVKLKNLRGTIQNDILKEYVARGTYIFPPRPSMRLICDIFEYCGKNMPRWNTISVSGYHMREAGCSIQQEIGFTLANAINYIQSAIEVGLEVDQFASRLSFFFGSGNDLFEESAKFRAARRLWARIMKERFGAKNPRSLKLRFHTQTCGHTLTAQQPLNNIARVAIQALAAILGGTQSLHTNSYDEAYALPSEEAVTIALRTQQILAYESDISETVDPLGGSYLIESLTNSIEEEAKGYITKIDELGGAMAAIEQGYMQREIQENAYRNQKEIEDERRIIIGVNKFISSYPEIAKILKVDPKEEEKQMKFLSHVKKEREQSSVKTALDNLEKVAKSTERNIMPSIIECVESYATVGEISDVLRGVFGEYKPPIIF